jgi:hypothetical protein
METMGQAHSNDILLIEPDYPSKFPPLGLMKISTYHKDRGDAVTFGRGRVRELQGERWSKIYVSSLFTYQLPRTVETVRYYLGSVCDPRDVVVGGIGATLLPDFIRERVGCTVISGQLSRRGTLGPGSPAVDKCMPDYTIADAVQWKYRPEDSYFCRITNGCIRNCKFCAVPKLEPHFSYRKGLASQLREVRKRFGERQNLVLLDNNVLASERLETIVESIASEGFSSGAIRNRRLRTVDFNQGIDARLVTNHVAKILSRICLKPVRLAFDHDGVEDVYRGAVEKLSARGRVNFTTYVMFNFTDDPASLYRRLSTNIDLSKRLRIRVSGFPMRYIPITDVDRRYVSPGWRWRYLRGVQCILQATHGVVSPSAEFFSAAFGDTCEEFMDILAMPDDYIIYRERYRDEAKAWRRKFHRLCKSSRDEFLGILETLNTMRGRKRNVSGYPRFKRLLEHYYGNR